MYFLCNSKRNKSDFISKGSYSHIQFQTKQNSLRETAWEYIEDCGVDATDTSALIRLSTDIMDKLDEITTQRSVDLRQSGSSKLEGIYEEYSKIHWGLMAIIFNRYDNECDEQLEINLS